MNRIREILLTPAPPQIPAINGLSTRSLSLKKSVDPQSVAEWRVDHFTRVEPADVGGMQFAMRPVRKLPSGTGASETLC